VSRRTRGGKPLFTWIKLVSGKQHFYEYLRKSKFKQNAAVKKKEFNHHRLEN